MDHAQIVCVVGLGYIGLPTAAILAAQGHTVIGVDVDEQRVADVAAGRIPFVEPDLESVLAGVVAQGRLTARTTMPAADVFIVAVPTPFTADKDVDPRFVRSAAEAIAPQLRGGELIILESTSPPGLTERMAAAILEARPDLTGDPGHPTSLHFAHCPERVLPGRIMIEIVDNDRIVGGVTPEAAELARALYATFCKGALHLTDARTAELAKLAENSYRDVNIAFANELSVIAERLDVDVWELIALANHHPRVDILRPGPGVGGHCIAVDPWFIVSAAPEESQLIRTAREVNDAKPDFVVRQVRDRAAGLERPAIAVLGVAFKPDIDDLRESPSVEVVARLAEALPEARLRVVEPHVDDLPTALAEHAAVELLPLEEALAGADLAVVLVGHQQFRAMDRSLLEGLEVLDVPGALR
ncbi:UDP-N-acetyl-D-mannosamine dehydrogenase [Agrococcus sp. SL85]|uniref:UDP-N-acetyl-D-mannosamine dehydrogenase n=1 Tax=Agrococcus sp. SL85 TaxID=2995141 RepID=UPI00226CA033|nr:UDP-N-acetyl-D-mannosamine dehydrogenase [Agrococcus sp. SL85]WAC66506.1 UDP-N-acetyl-D-mannosamine dehydrogenase [Agrococcus sp. SL85]